MRPKTCLIAASALLVLAAPAVSWAQGFSGAARGPALIRPPGQTSRTPTQQPPGLPGAQPNQGAAAPPDRAAADLPPTEALFDAINRGDLGTARDAVNRGAQLDGRNVLGMTPLELSIDLGRNDISFMLLANRDARPPPPAAAPAPGKILTARQPPVPARRPAAIAVAPIPPPQTPRLFAGDGGEPVPQAGFLGFGNAR